MVADERYYPRPPFDAEIANALANKPYAEAPTTYSLIRKFRDDERASEGEAARVSRIHNNPAISVSHIRAPGARGDIPILQLRPASSKQPEVPKPGVVFFHGGGMVMGTPYFGITAVSNLIEELDATIFSVDYSLAPESQGLEIVEDCYAALEWVASNMSQLKIDPFQLMVAGVSAGGALAAATALIARDRQGPRLCAQLLVCPMLDDRCSTVSAVQFQEGPVFNTAGARKAWSWVLGDQSGEDGISPYVAPGRATDLSDLPEAYIDAGSAEVFRDEAIVYAGKLWEAGVQAHLHIWGGGCHGFDAFEAPSDLGAVSTQTRNTWLRVVLGRAKRHPE